MDSSGKVIQVDGKKLLSFGTARIPVSTFSLYPESEMIYNHYHIGVNLSTGRVDEVKANYCPSVDINELTVEELQNLVELLPVLRSMKDKVLAITGKARSGKDTVANCVQAAFHDVFKLSLGDAIRQVRDVIYGPTDDKDRPALVMIGQNLRKGDPNVWIKAWLRQAIDLIKLGSLRKIVCADVRQPNEFSFFASLGALIVKMEADEELRIKKIKEVDGERATDPKLLNDETESYVDTFETGITLFNDYTVDFADEIYNKLIPVLRERGW